MTPDETKEALRQGSRQNALDRELLEMGQRHCRDREEETSWVAQNVGHYFRSVERRVLDDKYKADGLCPPERLDLNIEL